MNMRGGAVGNEFRKLLEALERAGVDRERGDAAKLHRQLGHKGSFRRCNSCRPPIRRGKAAGPAE